MNSPKSHWLQSVRPAFFASFLKKLLRIKRRVVETAHGRFFLDPASRLGSAIINQTAYEPDMHDALKAILRQGDVFLDLGANEGYFSIIASKLVGTQGHVIAVEPQSRMQEILFRNMAENDAWNIHVFQLAISDTLGHANIHLLPDLNSGGSGLFRATKYSVPTQIVPVTTLSRLTELLRLPKIRLMKIDVEGFEYEAILGSKELFASGFIEHIALELHPTILAARGKSGDDITNFLSECGYQHDHRFRNLILTKNSAQNS